MSESVLDWVGVNSPMDWGSDMDDEESSPGGEDSDHEEENLNPGGEETLLLNDDISNVDFARIAIAPGQGQQPCCSYIINYINKSNRGVSKLLREAMEGVKGGNLTSRQKLQEIKGNKFINGTERQVMGKSTLILTVPKTVLEWSFLGQH